MNALEVDAIVSLSQRMGSEKNHATVELGELPMEEADTYMITELGEELFGADDEAEDEKPNILTENIMGLSKSRQSIVSEFRSLHSRIWDPSPLEKDIYKTHTKWFGLFYKTFEMERVFLDGHAKLHKKEVYLGYCLVVLVSV